ncbi:MAG: Lrp/AsnC family transcriptional regulator [Verrucomicrobiota bacterium]
MSDKFNLPLASTRDFRDVAGMAEYRPDTLDLRIIDQLRADGRKPAKYIATELGVAEATVTSRIRTLGENRVMRVLAQRNMGRLNERIVCFIEVAVRGRSIDEVAEDLARIDALSGVNINVGSPELILYAFVENNLQVVSLLQNAIGQVPGVDRIEVHIALDIRTYRSDYGNLASGAVGPGGDDVDDRIIALLQEDGRESTREIARKLDMPASTVRERMNRLLQTNAIRIGVICDARSLGFDLVAYAFLSVEAAHIENALGHLSPLDEMGQVCSISGRYNIFVLFAARHMANLVNIVKTRLETAPGLIEVNVRLVSATVKHRIDLISIV